MAHEEHGQSGPHAEVTEQELVQRVQAGDTEAFDALFRGERNLPAWLLAYRKNRNGAEIPGRVEGGSYELYGVCEPHNCSDSYPLSA